MNGHDWVGMAGAYVLGALDGEERAAFEAELERNADLRSKVADLSEAAAGVGRSVPQVSPPPALRGQVLSQARQGRPLPARRRVPAAVPWIAAAASIAAAVAVGVSYGRLSTEADRLRQTQTELGEALRLAEQDVARQDSILATFSGPDVRAATLSPTGGDPSIRVFLDPARNMVVVAAFDLAPAPAGRTYQLWGIVGGQDPVSLGTFDTRPDGTALLALGVPGAIDFDISAVTDEPSGGSPQPTTQPFLVGSWSAVD